MSKTKADKRQKLSSSDEEFDPNQKDEDFDLIMDEEEREKFDKMTEKEREIEIYKRLEQREIMKTREKIKKKLEAAGKKPDSAKESSPKKKSRKRKISEGSDEDEEEKNNDEKSEPDTEEGEVDSSTDDEKEQKSKSTRSKVEIKAEPDESDSALDTEYHKPSELANKQNKKKAMADLLSKRRDKRHAEEKRKKETQTATLDLDEIFGNNDDDGKSVSSSSSSSSSRSSSPDLTRSRSPTPVPKQEIQTKDELTRCQLFRRKLAKFVHAPFFAKTVTGCYVRVSIGPNKMDGKQVYRVAQICDVVETAKIYEVEPNTDIRTNKGLRLKVCDGEGMRVYRLEFISNSPIQDSEYTFWLNKMKSSNTPLPTVDFVDRKRKEIIDALNYKYSEAEINLLVKEKQRFKRQPTNSAVLKAELLKMKEQAEQMGDAERIRDLQQQISELEEQAKKIEQQRTKGLSAINSINQRNRDLMKQTFLGAGIGRAEDHGKDDDPFTRKSARMKVVSGTVKGKLTSTSGGSIASSSLASHGSTSCSDTSSPSKKSLLPSTHDLFSAHGIDINIDIKMPAMASGSLSFKAPPIVDTGHNQQISQKSNSNTRTLTLEEYKKKRGLI